MKSGKLGINGLGRIGKLSIWQHVGRKEFSEILVNIGRQVGTSLNDAARFIEKDSTYGTLQNYLYGYKAGRLIENLTIFIYNLPDFFYYALTFLILWAVLKILDIHAAKSSSIT